VNVTTAEQRWDKVVGDFRQLCLYRRQKKWIESDMILNSDLPRSIASWSEVFVGEPSSKKSRLDAMFQNEQRRLDEAWFTMELLSGRFKEEIVPAICAQITEQVRAAIIEEVRGSLTQQFRNSIREEVRSAAVAEVRATPSQATPTAPAASPVRRAADDHLLSDFAEQVRSTVAQQACAAVLEELAREHKPAHPARTSSSARACASRVAFDDVPGVIDFVLAEEQQRLNNYKFELSACP
jgi:hypothetical protein